MIKLDCTMTELDSFYIQILKVGLIILRQAYNSGSNEWTNAEFELLHNIPTLIGETNKARHRYFWEKERVHYINWVNEKGSQEAKSRMSIYYSPIWKEMEPLVAQLLGS